MSSKGNRFIEIGIKLFLVVTLGSLFILFSTSCKKTEYTIQAITFPAGSKAHKKDWTYLAKIIVTSNHTPITDQSNKDVNIKILDSAENILFDKDVNFTCASIRATAEWEQFDIINLKLNEVGNSYARDEYNKKLIDNGPATLAEMTLRFDYKNKVFVENLNP